MSREKAALEAEAGGGAAQPEAEAGLAFAEAIPLNHTIVELNLTRNPMPYKFIVEIQKAIESNK